eukprot:TRINITY_DN18023_c0_g1_i1.p1 TRINITY_DN18023_c0_g1~~TRINITY_DN18023_c0_g1_i1.p1  ORF type:complete len:1562 (+),score=375.90 TRINITY_DN18023_c0_g1_i1:49-4686(+)
MHGVSERLGTARDRDELKTILKTMLLGGEEVLSEGYVALCEVLGKNDDVSMACPRESSEVLCKLACSINEEVRDWAKDCIKQNTAELHHVTDALQIIHETLVSLHTEPLNDNLFPSLDDEVTHEIPIVQNSAALWHTFHFFASLPCPTASLTSHILLSACSEKGYLVEETTQNIAAIEEAKLWFLTAILDYLPSECITAEVFHRIVGIVLPSNLSLLSDFFSQHPSLVTPYHAKLLLDSSDTVSQVLPLAVLCSEGTPVGDMVCNFLWTRFREIKKDPNWVDIGVATVAASIQTILKLVLKWSDLLAAWYTSARKGLKPPQPELQLLFPKITSLIMGLAEAWDTLSPPTQEQLVTSILPLSALLDVHSIERFLMFTRLYERLPEAFSKTPVHVLKQLHEAIDVLASKAVSGMEMGVLRVAYLLAPHYKAAHAAATRGGDAGEVLVETAKNDEKAKQWIGVALRACCAMDEDAEQSEFDSDVRLAVFAHAATGILQGIAKGLSPYLDSKYVGEVLQSAQRCMGFWLYIGFSFSTVMVAAGQVKPGPWAPSVLRCIGAATTSVDSDSWAVAVSNLAEARAFTSEEDRNLFTRIIGRHPNAVEAITRVAHYTPTAERLVAWSKGHEYSADITPVKPKCPEFMPQYTLGILDDDDDEECVEEEDPPKAQAAPEEVTTHGATSKGKAAFLVDMAARVMTPAPRMPKLSREEKALRQVAKLATGTSQVQIEQQPCGAVWLVDPRSKMGESKPINIANNKLVVQQKQLNSNALAAGDKRFLAMQKQAATESVRQLREKRFPSQQNLLLHSLLDAQMPHQLTGRKLPTLQTSYVSEDSYAKTLFPYILEEGVCGVQRAIKEFRATYHDRGIVTEVIGDMGEVVIEFEMPAQNFYSQMELVAMDFNTDELVLGKVTRNFRRHNQLRVCLTKAQLELMYVSRGVEVSPLTRVGSIFHQTWVINHLSLLPLFRTLLSAKPLFTPHSETSIPSGYLAYLGRRFNFSQRNAILKSASAEGISLIQGPPGTGKTHTILGLLGALLVDRPKHEGRHRNVLVVAPSNTAVDEVALRVATSGLRNSKGEVFKPLMVRVGVRAKVNQKLWPLFLEDIVELQLGTKRDQVDRTHDSYTLLCSQLAAEETKLKMMTKKTGSDYVNLAEKIRLMQSKMKTEARKRKEAAEAAEQGRTEAKASILNSAQLVFSTLGSCKDFPNKFTAVVIDEAAQCVEPDVLLALKHGAKTCVMVGDDKQLPATILSPEAQNSGYDTSLFARLRAGGHVPYLLSTQYRMHPDIRSFPSKAFYSNRLTDHESLLKRTQLPVLPYFVVNVNNGRTVKSERSSSIKNPVEASVVMNIVRKVKLAANLQNSDIGVITPYKDQSVFIQQRLNGVEVDTVDGYQGREKKAIVISCVRAPGDAKGLGFTAKAERVNVSLTRGQSIVIVVCHVETMAESDLWRKLIVDARERGVVFQSGSFEGAGSLPQPKGNLTEKDLHKDATRPMNDECTRAALLEYKRKKQNPPKPIKQDLPKPKVKVLPRELRGPVQQAVMLGKRKLPKGF